MTKREHDGRTDLSTAAARRRADAWQLLGSRNVQHTRAAAYLGGYAIECKLKVVAMEVHDVWTLQGLAERLGLDERAVYTHGLEALLAHVPSQARFRRAPEWHDFATQVNQWRPSWRYSPRDLSIADTTSFLDSVDRVFKWLSNNA